MSEAVNVTTSGADVLVVDDDPRNRRLLEGYLLSEGHQVRSASDGREALGMAHERVPDVILLDVMMPGLNGFEVCKTLKSHPITRMTQIMLVTALDGTPQKVEGLDGGADDYVTKPVRREEFMAKVRSLVRARRLLAELDEARATVTARNSQLEELEAFKETLAQTLIHDLKNPLTAVMGTLDLLSMKAPDEFQNLLHRCQSNAVRMHRMIMDLLDVAGLEEGRLGLHRERIETEALVRAAVEAADANAHQRELKLEVVVPDSSCCVDADGSVTRRVLDNLLANAMEHSPKGGRVTVEIVCRDEGICIVVTDQGPGIPPEHRERVFDKYARHELKKVGISTNRGLGLTFCRLAVEAHGGTIWVDDAADGGASFHVLLPTYEEARIGQSRDRGDLAVGA
jgi:signal transduction histidine kinase